MKVSPKENFSENFYSTMRIVFIFTKCSGLLPVTGLRQNLSNALGFSWFSINNLFVVFPCIIVHYTVLVAFVYSCVSANAISKYPEMALWLYGEVCSIMFLRFSKNFKKMISDIEEIERFLPPVNNNGMIRKKINLIATYFTFAVLANFVIQEVMYIMANRNCVLPKNETDDVSTSERTNECFLNLLQTRYIILFIFQVVKLQAWYLWSMSDALIISCCIYLENQFQHFNDVLFQKTMKESKDRVNWNELKAHYTRLSDLVRTVDKYINPITFATFFTNMILICQHLFLIIGNQTGSLEDQGWECLNEERSRKIHNLRTFISTGLMIIKSFCVLYASAQLYTTSRKPLEALGTMPRTTYTYESRLLQALMTVKEATPSVHNPYGRRPCNEKNQQETRQGTQRFMDQVYHSTVAFSGFELFFFKRETILTVCSVMVTYELMLIQM